MTLLDAYVPEVNNSIQPDSVLGVPEMNAITTFTGTSRIFGLDNYFADLTDVGIEYATGTQEAFNWGNLERLVSDVNVSLYAQSQWFRHAGPIEYYADSVDLADSWEYAGGWNVSMAFNDPTIAAPSAPSSLSATAVSSSQINLTWGNVANETGFKIERLGPSGPWSQIATRSVNVTSYSDNTGLAAGTAYSYHVRAYNAAGDSAFSAIASATTQSPPGATYTLNIASSNPSSGVSVSSFVGTGSFAYGTTPTSRSFASGSEVGVTCPSTLAGGLVFQKWQLDGNDYPSSAVTPTFTTVTMNSAHTLTAFFGTTPPPLKVLSSLTIEGPSAVDERNSAQYHARATYTDGSSAYVDASAAWHDDSSYASISSVGLLDTDAVSSDRDIEIEATFTAGGVTRTRIKDVTIRNTDAVPTYTLTRNVIGSGEIGYSPQGSSFPADTWVYLHANEGDGYVFSHWSGDASGTEDDIYIVMDQNQTVTAHFVVDTNYGNLRVNIFPPQAVAEGAQWKYDLFTSWRDSGNTQNGITPRINRYVHFKDIPGWITPNEFKASIVGGQTTVTNATYREILGSVQVTIEPSAAATAGARWRLDGGVWLQSGVALSDVATGNHTVQFSAAGGWSAAVARTVNVQRGSASVVVGIFDPPAGLPVISTLIPSSGGLDGGYSIEIEGANFGTNTTVTFGGIAAPSVTVVSATRLTATVPAGASYGSVSVAATSGGQTGTKVNGFTYSIQLSQNMTLLSQIGGTVGAVATSGNMVYYGEGCSIVSADYTTPTAPIIRGRLPLPGMVQDIRIVGNHALVANKDFGLQIVDVSDPVNLRLVGYFDTPGSAMRLGVVGNLAYVADQTSGLEIIDFTDRTAPRRAWTYGPAGAWDVAMTSIGGRTIACVSTIPTNGALLLDVTTPTNITLLSQLEPGVYPPARNIAVSGTTLVYSGRVASSPSTLEGKIYDISNPASPVRTGQWSGFGFSRVGLVSNGRLFVGNSGLVIYNLAVLPIPSMLSSLALGGSPAGMALAGNTLYMANGSGGLFAVNVANVSSPAILSTLNSSFRPVDIVVGSSKVYTAIDGGLTVIDVSNVRHPQRQGTAMSDYQLSRIVQSGNTVYAATGSRMTSFSVSNPSAPTKASEVQPPDRRESYCISYVNGNIAVGGQGGSSNSYRGLLSLYTAAGFQTGTPVSTLELTTAGGLTSALAVSGNTVFAFVESTLKCVDCSNPQSPQVIGSLNVSCCVEQAAVSPNGRFVYATDGTALRVFDCGNLSAPVLLASYAREGVSSTSPGVAASSNLVVYADNQRVNVLDCTDPAHPKLVASYDTPGRVNAIRILGNEIYVADGDGGLEILEIGDISQPLIEITGPTPNANFETTSAVIALSGTASDAEGIVRVTWLNERGGGGEATGTTSWNVATITLSPGTNAITVAAEDTTGNVVKDTITVIATPPDTTSPVVMITGPKPDDEFMVETNLITLSGSAVDNQSVTNLTWNNDRGGSGAMNLAGQNWSVTNLLLAPGPNLVQVTATDSSGNSASDTAVIFFVPPDTNAPSISIEFPTLNAIYETGFGVLNLSGTAADNVGVTEIKWTSNHGGQGIANGVAPWSVNGIPLQPSLNVIQVTAYDAAGNTATDALSVIFTQPIPELSVARSGNNLVLLWPTNAIGFALESAINFPAANWTLESATPAIVNDQYAVTNATTGEKRFYRLKK